MSKNLGMILCKLNGYRVFSQFIDLLGEKNALLFIQVFGGTAINIPSQEDLKQIERDYNIYLDSKKGVKTAELSRKYRVPKGLVVHVIKKYGGILGNE